MGYTTKKVGYVYACASPDGRFVKVGYTVSPERRTQAIKGEFRRRFKTGMVCFGWKRAPPEEEWALQGIFEGRPLPSICFSGWAKPMDWFHGFPEGIAALKSYGFTDGAGQWGAERYAK